jgi:acetyl-CoA C-acetyltransferase
MSEEVVIISAARTPIGKFGRAFKDVPAVELGAVAIREAVRRAGLRPDDIGEVLMGTVISAGLGQNPARQAAIRAGLPVDIGSVTINKVCGSGLKAVILATQAIKAGDESMAVAGGMENMSAAPYIIARMRWGARTGHVTAYDAMIVDGLWDAFRDFHMAETGERVAVKYGVTRRDADEYSMRTNQRAIVATAEGRFDHEIVPVEVNGVLVHRDGCVRENSTIEKLAALKPVFKKDGILTAGNSSKLSDGAAALVISSGATAHQLGIRPLAKIVDYAVGGMHPEDVMEAPIPVVRGLFEKTGMTMADIDLVEYNEAYATSAVVVQRELGVPSEKMNVNGGAVALGHPIGCSGARILVTLIYALQERGLKRGLATLCMGGGNAIAMIVER